MDYTGDNIGLRVNAPLKEFCVIVKQGGAWKQAGEMQKYPLPFLPTLATAKSSSDVAILMLDIENPSASKEFSKLVYPR